MCIYLLVLFDLFLCELWLQICWSNCTVLSVFFFRSYKSLIWGGVGMNYKLQKVDDRYSVFIGNVMLVLFLSLNDFHKPQHYSIKKIISGVLLYQLVKHPLHFYPYPILEQACIFNCDFIPREFYVDSSPHEGTRGEKGTNSQKADSQWLARNSRLFRPPASGGANRSHTPHRRPNPEL